MSCAGRSSWSSVVMFVSTNRLRWRVPFPCEKKVWTADSAMFCNGQLKAQTTKRNRVGRSTVDAVPFLRQHWRTGVHCIRNPRVFPSTLLRFIYHFVLLVLTFQCTGHRVSTCQAAGSHSSVCPASVPPPLPQAICAANLLTFSTVAASRASEQSAVASDGLSVLCRSRQALSKIQSCRPPSPGFNTAVIRRLLPGC